MVNPIQSDALRNLYIRKTKTDQKDSFILADLLRLGRATSTPPEELAQVDLTELADFLREHSKGHLGMDRAKRIQELAKGTFGISIAADAFTFELRLLLQQIEFIEEQIKEIEEAIDQVMKELRPSPETPYRHVIETIPGIGPVLAAAIIGEIGDIHRFPNAKALVAFAGIDVTIRASGQFEGTRNRMSKRGSPVLRHSLWLAAVSARRFHPEFKAYYETRKAQGKHPKVITGAIARKLAHLLFALWTDNRPFDPNYQWTAGSPN